MIKVWGNVVECLKLCHFNDLNIHEKATMERRNLNFKWAENTGDGNEVERETPRRSLDVFANEFKCKFRRSNVLPERRENLSINPVVNYKRTPFKLYGMWTQIPKNRSPVFFGDRIPEHF